VVAGSVLVISWYYYADDHRQTRQAAGGSPGSLGETPQNPEVRRDSRVIDRAGPIETGEDRIEWVEATAGKGLGLAQKKRESTRTAR
jgi:hypothetical protein